MELGFLLDSLLNSYKDKQVGSLHYYLDATLVYLHLHNKYTLKIIELTYSYT